MGLTEDEDAAGFALAARRGPRPTSSSAPRAPWSRPCRHAARRPSCRR